MQPISVFFETKHNLDIKIKILNELPWETVKYLCLIQPSILEICNSIRFWQYKIVWLFGTESLPGKRVRVPGLRKLYFKLTRCKFENGSQCKKFIACVEDSGFHHENNFKFCSNHCRADEDRQCRYVFARGSHVGTRCEREVGIVYRPYQHLLGADRYCFSCLKRKGVQSILVP